MGDFIEQIDPEAFEIVKNRQDEDGKPLETRCLFNHDPNHLLGRFPTTMRMTVDEKGLKYECLLPESRTDLEELISRGDLKGSSFSFVVAPDGGEQWSYENGQSRRIVKKIKAVLDCGPVTYPAYGDASVAVAKRSYEQFAAERQGGAKPPSPVRAPGRARPKPDRRSFDDLVAFLAERRDSECGRDEGGRFGSGNECQKDGTGGKGKSKYMELNPPLSPSETDEAQEFVDDAREGQLSAGGKDGGKADDGSGVQTWSKGDTYPWTVKQVGTDKGYVQGTHPDGSKTEKYPFEGGNTKEADRLLRDELKKKNEKRVAKAIEDTLKFLRERSR